MGTVHEIDMPLRVRLTDEQARAVVVAIGNMTAAEVAKLAPGQARELYGAHRALLRAITPGGDAA